MKNTATLREKYLQEKERILNEIGSLDQVLQTLGLSQRRACQLLLVDPSAWTRWSKTGAPPHIYQALSWLLQLKKLNPEAVAPTDIGTRVDFIQSKTDAKIKELERSIEMLERTLALQAIRTSHSIQAAPEEIIPQQRRLPLAKKKAPNKSKRKKIKAIKRNGIKSVKAKLQLKRKRPTKAKLRRKK